MVTIIIADYTSTVGDGVVSPQPLFIVTYIVRGVMKPYKLVSPKY